MLTREKFNQKVSDISKTHKILNIEDVSQLLAVFDSRVKHKNYDMSGIINYLGFSVEYNQDTAVLNNFFYYVEFDNGGLLHGKGQGILTACRAKNIESLNGFELL